MKDIPLHWNGGDPVKTHFLNAFSVLLPAYEMFFIKTISKNKGRIASEKLESEIRVFCAQEGAHASEHRKYNQMLVQQGYSFIPSFEKFVVRALDFVSRRLNRDLQLAMTAGGEHVTAFMGYEFLTDKARWQDDSHPVMKALWAWHAAEELEHKNVCFDVYQNIRGERWLRIVGLLSIAVPTIYMMSVIFFYLLFKDGLLSKYETWKNYFMFIWGKDGYVSRLLREIGIFSKAGFHPSLGNWPARN